MKWKWLVGFFFGPTQEQKKRYSGLPLMNENGKCASPEAGSQLMT